ncbi:MAG: four helix bundle protein [Bacteroidales bacterium]|jgi:four helix bundle protein|nr:four helix bundle protein [Bacteroidales bacterium]
MKIERFEEIIAWQKAKDLTTTLYFLFKDNRDFSFRDQILRASISVMNNIAEGFERGSDKDFKHFLFIAKSSSGEVRSMLYLAADLKYIDFIKFNELLEKSTEISKLLSGLIKTLQ